LFCIHNDLYCIFVDEIGGEIFDLLMSFGDFSEFKELMLSYKRAKQDSNSTQGGTPSISVFKFNGDSSSSKRKNVVDMEMSP
jgi:hypothetical protein